MAYDDRSSKFSERSKDYKAIKRTRFWENIFYFVVIGAISVAIVDNIFDISGLEDGYTRYLFITPNSDEWDEYYGNFFYVPIVFSIITIIVYLFHFANPRNKFIQKLEQIKQIIFNFLPFYFNGDDERNLYMRFGFKEVFTKGFFEREVKNKNYLEKKKLSIFTGEYSPDMLFEIPFGNEKYIVDMEKFFNSKEDYIDLFMIIEGYIHNNIDIYVNVPLQEYKAFGSTSHKYFFKTLKMFIEQNNDIEESLRNGLIKKIEELEDKKLSIKSKEKYINTIIKKYSTMFEYEKFLRKQIVFSPLALKELLGRIYISSWKYDENLKRFESLVRDEMTDAKPVLENEKVYEMVMFSFFFMLINEFMGLPSGIVTARAKDYDFCRIVDDLEHFIKSQGIRQIKKGYNDQYGSFDDRFARAFMIFFHEFTKRSKEKEEIKKYLNNFKPLDLEIDLIDKRYQEPKINFGKYDPKLGVPDFVKGENWFEKKEEK